MVVLGLVVGALYYVVRPTAPSTSTTPTQTPSPTPTPPSTTTPSLKITNVTFVEWIINEHREVCWRFRITGEVDLRERVTINGVYGNWLGRIHVILPNGELAMIFDPPNYDTDVSRFKYLSGTKTYDACVLDLDAWWGKSYLSGTYRISVILHGPYENRSVLFDKNFTYLMKANVTIAPTEWSTWNQSLLLSIVNTGDVPLVLQGVGIVQSGTSTSLGTVKISEVVVMSGKLKNINASIQVFDYTKENFRGKSVPVDFVLSFAGADQPYKVAMNVTFPKT
ncbi:MAG: hypothetical protein RMH77_05455 [Sulfolobales archaeon]|nr:hypothetical protein [Sulfolobales archaeon]MDW7969831.1 hypothetical protein [Sulfolobales archaeon]